MTQYLKVTIYGSYVGANKQVESFDGVTGIMPALDDDKVKQMAIKRYARMWLEAQKTILGEPKYKNVARIRQVFIDTIDIAEDMEGKVLSYVGKNIMEMSMEELQDLAAANDLTAVPVYKAADRAVARRIAFAEYASKVLGWTETNAKGIVGPIDHRREGYNPSNYPAIIVTEGIRRSGDSVLSNEEIIDREALQLNNKMNSVNKGDASTSRLTIEQLKAIATTKGIKFHPSIGYEALHKKIYFDNVAA